MISSFTTIQVVVRSNEHRRLQMVGGIYPELTVSVEFIAVETRSRRQFLPYNGLPTVVID